LINCGIKKHVCFTEEKFERPMKYFHPRSSSPLRRSSVDILVLRARLTASRSREIANIDTM